MKKILVTGGCGFIGANFVSYLVKQGWLDIRVLDNESLGTRENISEFDIEFICGDLSDADILSAALKDVDTVVHLAADTRVVDSIENPLHNFQSNVIGTFNLLNCMRESGIERLINASTGGAILGEAQPPVHERMAANPLSPYGASKLAAEGYCSAFAGAYGITAISLRFSNVYGPHSYHKGSVVAHFLKQVLQGNELIVYGDGNQTRDYLFVDDLCSGILQAIKTGENGVYQLGSGQPTTINELIELIKRTVGDDNPVQVSYKDFRPGEIRNTWCDINKARNKLDYNPKTSLKEGLKRTWEWFLNTCRDDEEQS
ncbi:GDP-mannose 4,6-dehydratase [Thermodesulfobacteriota bacterium]